MLVQLKKDANIVEFSGDLRTALQYFADKIAGRYLIGINIEVSQGDSDSSMLWIKTPIELISLYFENNNFRSYNWGGMGNSRKSISLTEVLDEVVATLFAIDDALKAIDADIRTKFNHRINTEFKTEHIDEESFFD